MAPARLKEARWRVRDLRAVIMVPGDPGHCMDRQRCPATGLGKPEYPTKPFSGSDEASLKQETAPIALDQTTGCDHVGTHFQLGLSRAVQAVFESHATATPLGVGR
jgi:hypothetical protein